MKTIVLPAANEKDLVDVPEKVRQAITFHPVAKMREVLKIALGTG
ncbi:MAG: hypothetical protein PVG19_00465 [Desulfobacterales bacterium]